MVGLVKKKTIHLFSPLFIKSVLTVLCLLFCGAASAVDNTPKKLLVIDSQIGDPYRNVRESMLTELAARGFKEGDGMSYEYYSLSHYRGAAKNLWNHRIRKVDYDVIFLNGTLAAKSFKDIAWNSKSYDFVFASVTDPVGLGIVKDYNITPEANFTGVAFHVPIEDRMRFIKRLMPQAKNIGLIYADMPQSHSYRKWIEEVLNQPEWQGVTVHFRQVDFIPSEGGHRRMAQMAEKHVQELDSQVDLFLSPNDQMGAQRPFANMVYRNSTKPLIGLGRHDVTDGWGATASIYPDEKIVGKQAAEMVHKIFNGEALTTILPERPREYGIVIDKAKAKYFGISIDADLGAAAELIPVE
ncbi:MAG: hypothetical protein K6L76_02330 [Agarilytica sp.]